MVYGILLKRGATKTREKEQDYFLEKADYVYVPTLIEISEIHLFSFRQWLAYSYIFIG